jgi:acetyl esterase/lipase
MKEGEVTYTKPDLVDTEVEWTGYRPCAGKDEPLPNISEEEKYKKLLAEPERTSDLVILYFHGGAYYLCDPSTHRPLTSRLAKESHGVVCSVRYRLAPQAAFPAQLLDALLMYLSLLYPPPGSMHQSIAAKNIVLGGDSAGGNLVFALLQLLLRLHRTGPIKPPFLRFHGKDVEVPLPAGVTANSGWFDIARSLPSLYSNVKYDYLPSPNHDEDATSRFPPDDVWPAKPPRGDLFCDLSLLDHPLASVVLADKWEGAPPIWMCTGEELLTDEDKFVAARAASQGVTVQYEEYEAMPHCFAMLMTFIPTAKRCLQSWADFSRRCVEEPASVKSSGTYVHAKTGKEDNVDVTKVTSLTMEDLKKAVRDAKERRIKGYEREGKGMPKPAL